MWKDLRYILAKWVMGVGLLLVGWAAVLPAVGQAHRPTEQFREQALLQSVEVEIALDNPAEAGRRLAGVLPTHGQQLMRDPDGRLTAVAHWAKSLLDLHPAVLPAYRREIEPHVQQAMRKVVAEADHLPEQLYGITRRFPRSASEDAILLAAAQRAMQLGDPISAGQYLQMRSSDAPAANHLLIADSSENRSAGLFPFDAPWFGLPGAITQPRSLPVSAGGMTFIAGASHLVTIDKEGQITWSVQEADGEIGADNIVSRSERGIVHQPAIATDLSGQPRIIVARQVDAPSQRLVIRAYSVADGKMLWDSAKVESLGETDFLGNPAICGRLLYAVGLTRQARGSYLEMIALEVATGRPVWSVGLGEVSTTLNPRDRRKLPREMNPAPYWQQSPPAITDDQMIVAPGNGMIVALDRFSGMVNWMTVYQRTADPTADQWKRILSGRDRTLVPPHQLARFSTTPHIAGEVVVVAPADSPQTFGLDRRTGKSIWTRDIAGTLIGGGGGVVVLAGEQIIACDARTGQERWRYQPPDKTAISGVPVVWEGVVVVPAAPNWMTFSVEDGKPAANPPQMPPARRILALAGIQRALRAAKLAESFGIVDD